MKRIDVLAQLVMDLYYQTYAKDGDFFTLDDFINYSSIVFYELLQEDFDNSIIKAIKITGLPTPMLSDEWYVLKNFKVEKENDQYFISIKNIFSFKNDVTYSGIKDIYPKDNIGDCCSQFAKIKASECNTLKFLPKSDNTIYYFPLGDKVYLKKVNGRIDEVTIAYIPTLDESVESGDIIVPNSLQSELVKRTYNLMLSGKNATPIIDKTNNQNPNKLPQTEIDTPKN